MTIMRYCAILALFIGLGCIGTTEPASPAITGVYVLDSLDGVRLPVLSPSFFSCSGPITRGELNVSPENSESPNNYGLWVSQANNCESPKTTDSEIELVIDFGTWNARGNRVEFHSGTRYGLGDYGSEMRSPGSIGGLGPVLALQIGEHRYSWRRVRTYNSPAASISIEVIDQDGKPVANGRLEFRYADGLTGGLVSSIDRPIALASAPPGTAVSILLRPPAGYSIASGQQYPARAVAGQTEKVTIRLIRS